MGSTPLGGCIGYFLKFLFSNFRSHIKDSKWGRKCIFINCTSCNGRPKQIPFQFANGKLPHSRCRGFWAVLLIRNNASIWHTRVSKARHILRQHFIQLAFIQLQLVEVVKGTFHGRSYQLCRSKMFNSGFNKEF